MTLKSNQDFKVMVLLTINIPETLRDTDSRTGILIGTYTRPTEGCHFKRPWMTYRNFEWQ